MKVARICHLPSLVSSQAIAAMPIKGVMIPPGALKIF
jgi:hypothetical protein